MVRKTVIIGCFLLMFSSMGGAQECIDYGEYLHQISSTLLSQVPEDYVRANDIIAQHDTLIIAARNSGLISAVINDDQTITVLSSTPTWGTSPLGLYARNNHLYVADGLAGLQVFDISDAASPQWLAHIDTPGVALDVEATNDRALILDDYLGLVVIDIHEVRSPRIIASLSLPGTPTKMVRSGNVLFIACDSGGMAVVDISFPDNPRLTKVYEFPDRILHIAVGGNILALTGYYSDESSIQFFNISDPSQMVILSELFMPVGECRDMFYHGDILVVSGYENGLLTINASDATAPFVQGYYYSSDIKYACYTVVGDVLVAVYKYVELVEFQEAASAPLLAFIPQESEVFQVAVNGDYAYSAGYIPRLQIASFSNLDSPCSIVFLPEGASNTVAVHNGYLYLGSYVDGVDIFSLEDPMNPVLTYHLDGLFMMMDMVCINDILLLASLGSFSLYDLSVPGEPQFLSETSAVGSGHADIKGDYLYLATNNNNGLLVYNISDASAPVFVTNIAMAIVRPVGVFVDQDFLYVANDFYNEGLKIFDISFPMAPFLIATVSVPSSEKPCWVKDSIIYSCPENGPIVVIDAHDPYNPEILGGIGYYSGHAGIVIDNDKLFIQGTKHGLEIASLQCSTMTAVHQTPAWLQAMSLNIYPNPFNPRTNIQWVSQQTQYLKVAVYDLAGRRVALLADHVFDAGFHNLQWDGTDTTGAAMSSGVYLVSIQHEDTITSQQISLVR